MQMKNSKEDLSMHVARLSIIAFWIHMMGIMNNNMIIGYAFQRSFALIIQISMSGS